MAMGGFGGDHGDGYGAEDGKPLSEESVAEPARLDLDDGDEQLPWLESDEDYEQGGVDTGRIVAFALIGLLVIGLVVGALWFFTRDRSDPALVADGGTIEAPDGPYKTRPENPGGKTFAGTGDTSFAVAEGQSREGKLAEEAPRPSVDAASADKPAPPAEDVKGGVGVQVGAYSNRAAAEQGWATLQGRYSALQGVRHRIVEGQADIGTVYRLQAVAGDAASANGLCNAIKAAGGACQVKQ